MKIPDFLKNRMAVIAVSLICTALGIAGYDFTIHDGEALGVSQDAEVLIQSDDDVMSIEKTPGGLYQFRVQGDVFLIQKAVNTAKSSAIPCGCETELVTAYKVDQVVKLRYAVPLSELLTRVQLPKSLQSFKVKEWENVKVTFLGFTPQPETPQPSTPEKK